MKRDYCHVTDFLRIRDMLADNYRRIGRPDGWTIERWQYALHLLAHLRGKDAQQSAQCIATWKSLIRVWEVAGQIVAVVHTEEPWPGEAYLHRRPGTDHLLDEMLEDAECRLSKDGLTTVMAPDRDAGMVAMLQRRGYTMNSDWTKHITELDVRDVGECRLPAGYAVRSMADCDDIERRRSVLSRGFDHADPADWTRADTYEYLMQAPDYRRELDLYVVAPDGEYASNCILWADLINHIGILEPVSTPPEHRRRGFGREVIYEAARRGRAMGLKAIQVGTGMPFYRAIGFKDVASRHAWTKRVGRSAKHDLGSPK